MTQNFLSKLMSEIALDYLFVFCPLQSMMGVLFIDDVSSQIGFSDFISNCWVSCSLPGHFPHVNSLNILQFMTLDSDLRVYFYGCALIRRI